MTENIFHETSVHPLLHFHVSHRIFLSFYFWEDRDSTEGNLVPDILQLC